MSKWIGEGEKTVKALFAIATYRQPAVVFIDEIDSLLCQRSADENEATRRMKTEFLVQLDGAGTDLDARVVIVGATNRPEELDEAVRRRFVKRLYIPLPDEESRSQLFGNLLGNVKHELSVEQISNLVDRTKGYSGADIKSLCTEAAMGPLRELARNCRGQMESISASEVPSIKVHHFESALKTVQPSVSTGDLKRYLDWNTLFGSYRLVEDA
jgi:SpoVK/Ycf46/Vps4 family AAA+-type ATPase